MTCAGCSSCFLDNPNIPTDAHEIHLTVENADVDAFKAACAEIGCKPVLIAMQDERGGTFHQLMTSRTVRGTQEQVLAQSITDHGCLTLRGFLVSRIKIETTLTNPDVERWKNLGYFESHIEILIPKEELISVKSTLATIDTRLRISNNAFKVHDHKVSYFVTLRVSDPDCTPKLFAYEVDDTVEFLSFYYEIGKVRSEFAWFDSNLDLDREWK